MNSFAHDLHIYILTWNITEMELFSIMNERVTKVIIDLDL